jgi:rhamnosyltransferase
VNQKFKICAVMVCFYPDIRELENHMKSIIGQVDKLIIVDNSEEPTKRDPWTERNHENKIEWIALRANLGIGAAHNVGIKMALEQSFEGIVLLDQDSNPPDNLVSSLVAGVQFLEGHGVKVACIGPEIFNKNTNENYIPLVNKGLQFNEHFSEKDVLISSGTLLLSKAVKEIGLMDESLFIDLVDFEWCWRAKNYSYKVFSTNQVRMGHMVGQKNIKILNLYNLLIPSPIRHYYQFRNTLLLIQKGYVPKYWKFKALAERGIDCIVYPLFVSPRLQRIRYIIRGIIDGFANRKGKFTNG